MSYINNYNNKKQHDTDDIEYMETNSKIWTMKSTGEHVGNEIYARWKNKNEIYSYKVTRSCKKYAYLDVKIVWCEKEIKQRITNGEKMVLWIQIYDQKPNEHLIYNILMEAPCYALLKSNNWMNKRKEMLATEMDCWHRSILSHLSKIKNERVREMIDVQSDIIQQI